MRKYMSVLLILHVHIVCTICNKKCPALLIFQENITIKIYNTCRIWVIPLENNIFKL